MRADAFAKTKGFYELVNGYSCLIVIDPTETSPSRIQVFWDLARGCEYLQFLRSR